MLPNLLSKSRPQTVVDGACRPRLARSPSPSTIHGRPLAVLALSQVPVVRNLQRAKTSGCKGHCTRQTGPERRPAVAPQQRPGCPRVVSRSASSACRSVCAQRWCQSPLERRTRFRRGSGPPCALRAESLALAGISPALGWAGRLRKPPLARLATRPLCGGCSLARLWHLHTSLRGLCAPDASRYTADSRLATQQPLRPPESPASSLLSASLHQPPCSRLHERGIKCITALGDSETHHGQDRQTPS